MTAKDISGNIFVKVVVLMAITIVVSNNVIQFFENLAKNYAVAVIAFIFLAAILNTKLVEVFK